jgi:mono/diheme cytochrome c family protein
MRKPLVWSVVIALAALSLAACSPKPLPPGSTEASSGAAAPAEQPKTEPAAEAPKQAASGEPAKETPAETSEPAKTEESVTSTGSKVDTKSPPGGGGVGGDIFRIGMNASGPVAFTGGDGQAVAPCVQCHGAYGAGGVGPDIRFANLRHRGYDDAKVVTAVTKGTSAKGKSLGKQMPRFRLTNEEATSLVDYLKLLP